MGLLPGWPIEAGKAEIAQVVAQAAQAHRFLANNPPDPVWNGSGRGLRARPRGG
jgi:acetylornithine deacetylase